MRTPSRFAFVLVLAAAAGCGYSPNPPSMSLICGPQSSCPEGYGCVDNTCWKQGQANLVGHWVFGAKSTQVVVCTDGSTQTDNLQGPEGFLDVMPGATSELKAFYYCPWNLDIVGSATAIESGQSCSAPDAANPGVTYTWRGQTLAVTTNDGKKGNLAASLPYDYVTLTGNGSCTLKIAAELTKTFN